MTTTRLKKNLTTYTYTSKHVEARFHLLSSPDMYGPPVPHSNVEVFHIISRALPLIPLHMLVAQQCAATLGRGLGGTGVIGHRLSSSSFCSRGLTVLELQNATTIEPIQI